MIPHTHALSSDPKDALRYLTPKQLARLHRYITAGKPFEYEPKKGIKIFSVGAGIVAAEIDREGA